MISLIQVAAGGALGALARYGVATWLTTASTRPTLPWGTVFVNLVGCLVIGLVFGAAEGRGGMDEGARLFLVIGILGGFTTFSAFGLETWTLLRSDTPTLALVNAVLQLGGGLAGVGTGWFVARLLWAGAAS